MGIKHNDTRSIAAIAVVGSRNFPDRSIVESHLFHIKQAAVQKNRRLHIITGGAPGVDTWAAEWALANQIMFTVIPAEWDLFGKSAGYRRNPEIWDKAHAGIAFWDGQSNGTKDSFDIAKAQGKKIQIVRADGSDSPPW